MVPGRVTSCVTSESREENAQMYQEELESARIERDTWRSLDELSEKIDQLNLPGGVMKYKTDEYMLFVKICTKDVPSFLAIRNNEK